MSIKRILCLYCTLAVICLFLACLSTNYDYDLFARLIVGEKFIEEGIFPYHDFLSYTPTHAWFDHEWGSGVVFYLILKYAGPIGFLLFEAFALLGTAFFVIKTQRLQKHPFPTSLIFMSIFCVLLFRLNSELVRCQLFSFFFFSMFLYFCEKNKKTSSNLIWFVPLITIIWNNLHGGIVSGLGLIFLYFIGAIIDKQPWKKYFAVLALSTPLLVINPYGYKYLNFLFSATTMQRKYIVEWWPFYASSHFLYYLPQSLFGIFALITSFCNSLKNKNITKLIVLSVTLYLGLAHVKLLSLTIITASALCYNDICFLFLKLKNFLIKFEKSLYLVIFILFFTIPFFSPNYERADTTKFPFQEVEFLKINNLKGNIVVPFGFGSYVSYKLYPDNLIYMDGRYEEVYNDKEFLTLKDYELALDNWQDIINNYDTEILMPLKTIDVYEKLKQDRNWTLIFEGYKCGIFVKTSALQSSYKEPEYKIDYYKKNIFMGEFGKKLRRKK